MSTTDKLNPVQLNLVCYTIQVTTTTFEQQPHFWGSHKVWGNIGVKIKMQLTKTNEKKDGPHLCCRKKNGLFKFN
jgi:hypothetical protein